MISCWELEASWEDGSMAGTLTFVPLATCHGMSFAFTLYTIYPAPRLTSNMRAIITIHRYYSSQLFQYVQHSSDLIQRSSMAAAY